MTHVKETVHDARVLVCLPRNPHLSHLTADQWGRQVRTDASDMAAAIRNLRTVGDVSVEVTYAYECRLCGKGLSVAEAVDFPMCCAEARMSYAREWTGSEWGLRRIIRSEWSDDPEDVDPLLEAWQAAVRARADEG